MRKALGSIPRVSISLAPARDARAKCERWLALGCQGCDEVVVVVRALVLVVVVAFDVQAKLGQQMTAVGFEPTPLRTGAWGQRLRPLGQTALEC